MGYRSVITCRQRKENRELFFYKWNMFEWEVVWQLLGGVRIFLLGA